jgi:BioD-like phosphotransacetylase family protein
MKTLYVTSVERYSGKTAVCLALGKRFQEDGHKVGYLKPLSIQPWLEGGKIVDQDATFVKDVLGLDTPLSELSPVVVTQELLKAQISGKGTDDLIPKVQAAAEAAGQNKDILLLEGGGSLREGYVVNLPTPQVAKALKSKVLAVVKYRDEIRLMDDVLTAKFRLGDSMCGAIINRVPAEQLNFVDEFARPYIEEQGIPVFGVLPEVPGLAALMVDEIIDALEPQVLTDCLTSNILVESITIGAMTADAALSRLRTRNNTAVITGGDRTDVQIAALETPISCLILTGCLEPRSLIIKQANALGVPILLVRINTMETVEAIEKIFGKTRMGQVVKLEKFRQLLAEHVDMKRLYEAVGL